MKPARIGCSGWNYADWRGLFYPEREPQRRWLELYALRFDTVEVNTTFYRLPRRDAVATGCEQTPDGFTFAVKASRYLTHIKRLTDLTQGVARFYERIEPLVEAGRLGPVLWQLPGNFARDDQRLSDWLEALPAGLHTIEFRHQSWFAAPVMRMLRENGSRSPSATIRSARSKPTTRRRRGALSAFTTDARGRGGNYSAAELDQWARRIAQWRRRTSVWAYFNNDWRALAPANAASLTRRLGISAYGG